MTSEDEKPAAASVVEYATFRVYRQADGRYKAFGSVERTDSGLKRLEPSEGASMVTAGEALASVLQVTGFLG